LIERTAKRAGILERKKKAAEALKNEVRRGMLISIRVKLMICRVTFTSVRVDTKTL
jgi:hypothetical protein